jgi:hypothetical protein
MKIRSQMAWLGALSVFGAAACGGTAFNAIDAGGDDASLGNGDGSKPDAAGTMGHDSGAHDAGKAMDAAGDRSVKDDAVAADASGDATEQDGHAGKDAGVDGGSGTGHDAEVDAGQDAGHDAGACASKLTTAGIGVYLQSGGSATGCGTPAKPCPDLPSALGALDISLGRNHIYVAPGTYAASAPIALPDGVTISGGWTVPTSGPWTGSCDPMDTPTFEGSGEAVLTVGATTPSAGHVTLDTVNVLNTAVASPSESLYGILAVGSSGSSLILNDVSITVQNAGPGAPGAVGQPGLPAANGAPGCSETSGGNVGAIPSSTTGSYGPAGYTALQATLSNEAGRGQTGATPAAVTTCPPAGDGSGTPGDGNPTTCSTGTTAATCAGTNFKVTCAPPSNSGCGGAGGYGGYPAGGGGASIALFLWGEDATVQSGALIAGNGGAGGVGGAGGGGGSGGTGVPGGATAGYYPGCHIVLQGVSHTPVCALETGDTVTAAAGSMGGTGGAGGEGAGGSGGDSYSYYSGNNSTVTVLGSPTFTSAIMGAAGGGPNGAKGYTGQTNTAD